MTLIHPEVGTDVSFGCEALTEVMADEIGHTFGLDHCQTGGGGGGGGYYCTPYFWVYYESIDGGPWQEVDRWYAGCW